MRRRNSTEPHWPTNPKTQSSRPARICIILGLCFLAFSRLGADLAAQNVIISEFLTSNTRGITDENNDRVDWIEIHNRDTNTVNLLNWSLTDTTNNYRKWVFPETNLPPGNFMIIFASSKDRKVPGSRLHTSFGLSTSGEYLGLVRPDGSIATEFYQTYPSQVPDVSYGFSEQITNQVLIGSNAPVAVLIPTAETDTNWTGRDFDDAVWTRGTNGVGYGTSVVSIVKTDVRAAMSNVNASAYARIAFVVADPANVLALNLRLRYDDGHAVFLNGAEVARANAPETLAFDSAATNTHSGTATEQIQLTGNLLRTGTNILAVHGLNIAPDDEDFFIHAQLDATVVLVSALQPLYFTVPTPGAANGAGLPVLGPAILEPIHTPNVPLDSQDVQVTTRIFPVAGAVTNVVARYRVMFGPESEIRMFDDGLHGDGRANDGVYGATLPFASASTNGQMLRWYFRAIDNQGRTSRWPITNAPTDTEYLGTIVNPTNVTSKLPIVHFFANTNYFNANDDVVQFGINSQGGGRVSVFFDGEFYDNVEMELRGNSTAGFRKKSHRVDFNRDHEFRHPGPAFGLFEPETSTPQRIRHTSFVADYPDPTYMRQGLAYWLCQLVGAPAPFYYPVRMQMNGQFYQLANHNDLHEEELLSRLGYDPRGALYNAAGQVTPGRASTGGFEKKTRKWDTNDVDYATLANAIVETLPTGQRKTNVFDLFDIPEVIDYLVVGRWVHENDDVWANMSLYYDNEGDNLWRIVPFDMNLSWGAIFHEGAPTCTPYIEGVQATNDAHKAHPFYGARHLPACNSGNYNRVYHSFFDIPETREMYLRRMRTMLDTHIKPIGTPVSTTAIEQRILAWRNLIAEEAARDRARWGWPGKGGQSNFDPGIDLTNGVNQLLTNFFLARRQHFYGKHCVTNTALPVGTNRTENAGIPTRQSFSPRIAVTSMDVNPASGNQSHEFICLSNHAPFAVDISGWKLAGAVDFTFRPGTVINSNGLIFVSPDVRAFRSRATSPRGGQGLFVVGPYEGQLSARGETITIRDDQGRLISTNNYAGNPSLAQQALRVTEIMYHPSVLVGNTNGPEEFEYIELKNMGTNAINLAGIRFNEGIQFSFTSGSIGPGQTTLLVKNAAAFTARYGSGPNVSGQYTGSLDNGGERMRLVDAAGEEILDFEYNNSWYPITDGHGFSLVIVDEQAEPDAWNDKANWRASAANGGSPGATDPGPPAIGRVLINEALSRTDAPPPTDSIELYNPTTNTVNLAGWFLTDDFNAPQKYRIPNGTNIPPGGYLVFDEGDFNANPSSPFSFALSSDDDEVYLFSADAIGNLTGYFHGFDFGAADDGVTFGRHVISTGEEHFVAQSASTLGAANSLPKVGSVVINEIMYRPPDLDGTDNSADEFIELLNITASSVELYDPMAATNTWRLSGGVDFNFPGGVALVANEFVLLVNFDPNTNAAATTTFRNLYSVSPGVRLFGPYKGKLNNSSDDVELKKPSTPTTNGVPYVLVDKVDYRDSAPWPAAADGFGLSLQRIDSTAYGNDPANWTAAPPTAGEQRSAIAPIEITSEPEDQRVVSGTNVTFIVAATGTGLQYQWHLNGAPLAGATAATLQLIDVQPAQGGDYQVVVYNGSASAVSRVASLRVDVSVGIFSHPRSQNVPPGTNVTFSVGAYSDSPITYQWRKNGTDVPGATGPSLALSGVTRADDGFYTVVVSDVYRSVESTPGILTILIAPTLAQQPYLQATNVYSTIVPVGTDVTLTAACSNNATLPLTFRWRRISAFITNIVTSNYVSSYSIPAARTNDGGNYTLVITNLAGATVGLSSNAYVTVVVPPTNQTVVAGSNATFVAQPFGATSPRRLRLQWQFNNTDIPNATNNTLTITNVQQADLGTYSAVVTDQLDRTASFSAQLQFASINPRLSNPQMLSNGHFQTTLEALANHTYLVQYSTNLSNWVTLRSVSATSESTPVVDEDAPNSPQRFYRVQVE